MELLCPDGSRLWTTRCFIRPTAFLIEVFGEKHTEDLYEYFWEKKFNRVPRLVEKIAGRRYPSEVVAGVVTVVQLAGRNQFVPLVGQSNDLALGQVFAEARLYSEGRHPRLLLHLRKMRAELPHGFRAE